MLRKLLENTKPLRFIYNVIAILCIFFTLISITYDGYFVHRKWVNERIAASYENVEQVQKEVIESLLKTLPSKANNDRILTQDKINFLRVELTRLSGSISKVDSSSKQISLASDHYRGSISSLSKAIINYDPLIPNTQAKILLELDRLDVSAKNFSIAVENRIEGFFKTIWPSV